MKETTFRVSIFSAIFLVALLWGCGQQTDKTDAAGQDTEKLEVPQIPPAVMAALKAKFPQAEISKWSEETENDIVLYDIEFTQAGQKFESDIGVDGAIHNWEKQIKAADLPEAVTMVIETKYPEAALKEIMEIMAVTDGQDALEGYEIVLETADMAAVEVTLSPDGEILEESSDE